MGCGKSLVLIQTPILKSAILMQWFAIVNQIKLALIDFDSLFYFNNAESGKLLPHHKQLVSEMTDLRLQLW